MIDGTTSDDERLARLYALKHAAELISDPTSALGRRARRELPEVTGLSPEGVDLAIAHCLEASVPRGVLSGLCARATRARRAHVLLSANVFVGSFRAIALALTVSPQVFVRASRREPTMTELLHEGSGGAFEMVNELTPSEGDAVFAYGHDETLRKVRAKMPAGIRWLGHGSGMGVAVFRESAEVRKADLHHAVDGLARDVALFDQRGCSSPRLVFVAGSREFAEEICDHLVDALDRWEQRVPRGRLDPSEQADIAWHETTMFYLGSSVSAGRGLVFLDPVAERVVVPPTGRILHVTLTRDVVTLLERLRDRVTTVGLFNPGPLVGQLHQAVGRRRYVDMGQMQSPAFDGPVDLRNA